MTGSPSSAGSSGPERIRAAINAPVEYARQADDPRVEPVHLLRGVLDAPAGVAATVRTEYGWQIPPARVAQPRYPLATGIFTPGARRIVAEDALVVAERLGHRALTTGHVLIAILEHPGEHASEIVGSLPELRELTAAVIDALPSEEDT